MAKEKFEEKEGSRRKDAIPEEKIKASYEGVHNIYSGVYDTYSGVHGDYPGVDTNRETRAEEDPDPTVAPGMRDFLEEDAAPEEIEKGDYTKVTTLSFDETH